jgi:putative transposase
MHYCLWGLLDSCLAAIDGGKKIKGHKRHIIVDVLGNLLHVSVHAANKSDTIAACDVLERTSEKYPLILAYSGDAGYRGTAVKFTDEKLNLTLHIAIQKNSVPLFDY